MIRFNRYISNVKSGKVVTGEFIKLAIDRHESDLKRKDIYFDTAHVEKVIKICEIFRHWKGAKAGEKIHLEDWQVFLIGSIFGWKRTDSGLRRFTRTYIQVARKNGKTTLLALISLIHLLLDDEQGAQVYCGATKEDQARILVNDAGQIVEATPEARKMFKSFKYKDLVTRLSYTAKKGFIAALGRDSKTQDGFDPSMGNIDEFHEHQTSELLNVIVSGMGSRMQPLLNIITTAGFQKEYPCYSVTRKTIIEILRGMKEDDTYFGLIYEPDEADNWDDPHCWVKANPNLGASVRMQYLRDSLQTAKNEGGRTEVNFKTKHLNIWTDAPEVWIPDDIWMQGGEMLSDDELIKYDCHGGLDLGKSLDLNAFVLLFLIEGKYYIKPYFWIPEDTLKKADRDDYNQWVNDELMSVMPGAAMRPEIIANDILDISRKFKIKSIAYDPYLATHGVIQILTEYLVLSPLQQRLAVLSPFTKEFERLIFMNEIQHGGHPILRWMISNCVLQSDSNGNIKIDKKKSGNKIDGIDATINALSQYMDFEEQTSVYESRDILFI